MIRPWCATTAHAFGTILYLPAPFGGVLGLVGFPMSCPACGSGVVGGLGLAASGFGGLAGVCPVWSCMLLSFTV